MLKVENISERHLLNLGCRYLSNAFGELHKHRDVIQDSHGNMSLLLKTSLETGFVFIKPSGLEFDKITQSDVCVTEFPSGKSLNVNNLKPSVDLEHHLEVYRRYPSIKAIGHTHSPFATALSSLRDLRIPCMFTEQADRFGEELRILKYSSLDEWGKNVNLLSNEKVVLLQNHGTLIVSNKSIKDIVDTAVNLENVCKKIHLAFQLSATQDCVYLSIDEAKKWYNRYNSEYGQ